MRVDFGVGLIEDLGVDLLADLAEGADDALAIEDVVCAYTPPARHVLVLTFCVLDKEHADDAAGFALMAGLSACEEICEDAV